MPKDSLFLPGLRAVGLIRIADLPASIIPMSFCSIPIPLACDILWLDLEGSANTAQRTAERCNASLIYSASAEFRTKDPVQLTGEPLAVVIVDQMDRAWLIGADRPPYPVITEQVSTGAPPSQAAGYSYSVSHKAIRTMVRAAVVRR